MIYYKFTKSIRLEPAPGFSYDDILSITPEHTVVDSILTEKEFSDLQLYCRAFDRKAVKRINIPKNSTYYFFGVRFYE